MGQILIRQLLLLEMAPNFGCGFDTIVDRKLGRLLTLIFTRLEEDEKEDPVLCCGVLGKVPLGQPGLEHTIPNFKLNTLTRQEKDGHGLRGTEVEVGRQSCSHILKRSALPNVELSYDILDGFPLLGGWTLTVTEAGLVVGVRALARVATRRLLHASKQCR